MFLTRTKAIATHGLFLTTGYNVWLVFMHIWHHSAYFQYVVSAECNGTGKF